MKDFLMGMSIAAAFSLSVLWAGLPPSDDDGWRTVKAGEPGQVLAYQARWAYLDEK